MKKQNMMAGFGLTGIATILLLLGIWAFKGDYFYFKSINHLGALFNSFFTGMYYLMAFAMFFILVANVIVGILYAFNIIKSHKVIKTLAEVLAIIVVFTFLFFLFAAGRCPIWALWIMLIVSIIGVVWNYVYKKF